MILGFLYDITYPHVVLTGKRSAEVMSMRNATVLALLLLVMVAGSCSAMDRRTAFMSTGSREVWGKRRLGEVVDDADATADDGPLQYSGSSRLSDGHHGIPRAQFPPGGIIPQEELKLQHQPQHQRESFNMDRILRCVVGVLSIWHNQGKF